MTMKRQIKSKTIPLPYVLLPFSYYYLDPIIFIAYFYGATSLFAKLRVEVFLTLTMIFGIVATSVIKSDPKQ